MLPVPSDQIAENPFQTSGGRINLWQSVRRVLGKPPAPPQQRTCWGRIKLQLGPPHKVQRAWLIRGETGVEVDS